MILTKNPKFDTKVDCICDVCGKPFTRWYNGLVSGKKKRKDNRDLCRSCICKLTIKDKPQCHKEYWTEQKKKEHGQQIHEEFEQGKRKKVCLKGELNGMFGKKHTEETRNKMKEKRKYRVGELAPCWKGGKEHTLNYMVKHYLHVFEKWYYRVHEKFHFHCANCGTNKIKLDAHHIKPITKVIKELLEGTDFKTKQEQYEYLIKQPEILDKNLENGICLCRDCHKKVHHKWGSHNAEVKNETIK